MIEQSTSENLTDLVSENSLSAKVTMESTTETKLKSPKVSVNDNYENLKAEIMLNVKRGRITSNESIRQFITAIKIREDRILTGELHRKSGRPRRSISPQPGG